MGTEVPQTIEMEGFVPIASRPMCCLECLLTRSASADRYATISGQNMADQQSGMARASGCPDILGWRLGYLGSLEGLIQG